MSTGKLDALFRNWLALHEAQHCPLGDEAQETEIERLSDERIVIERAILAGSPETEDDRRAQLAVLTYYAVHTAPYANYEVVEGWYQRLVVERLPEASLRTREREGGRKRMTTRRSLSPEIDLRRVREGGAPLATAGLFPKWPEDRA
jgi:hypothetical protein